MDRADTLKLAYRLRAVARGDWLAYIDASLPFVSEPAVIVTSVGVGKPLKITPLVADGCPVCAARRKTKAAAQKRWRDKRAT